MKTVTNKLGLNEDASEASILAAVNKVSEDLASTKEALEAAETAKTEAEKKITELQNKYDALKTASDEAATAAATAETESKKTAAVSMVENFAKIGKIKNDATVKTAWVDKAVADFDGVKKLIEDLPINKAGVDLSGSQGGSDGKVALPTNAFGKMAELKAKAARA